MYNLIEFNDKSIRTPVDLIQVVTAGGIKMGTIVEAYGGNGSGKSSMAYSMAAMFQDDNKYGIVHIIDAEGSADYIRFKHTFKMDMERTIVRNESTLESAFEYIATVIANHKKQLSCKLYVEDIEKYTDEAVVKLATANKIEIKLGTGSNKTRSQLIFELLFNGIIREKDQLTPHFIVWDSIAASRPRASVDSLVNDGKVNLNAGGLQQKVRIITEEMNIVMSNIANKPITLFILNQVSLTGFGSYTGPKESSSGGNALKHAAQYRFYFHKLKHIVSENKKDIIGTLTEITIEKAKFCPKVVKTQIFIDDKLGGKIVSKFELPLVAKELGILTSSGAWFHFTDESGKKIGRNYRWSKSSTSGDNYIEDNEAIRQICFDKIASYYRRNYLTVDETYKYLNNTLGDPGVDERCFPNSQSTDSSDEESSTDVNLDSINEADILSIEQ